MKRKIIFSQLAFILCQLAVAQSAVKTTLVEGSGRSRQEGPAMVCDGSLNTKWCVDEPRLMPYTIVLDAGSATPVAEYGLVTGDDTSTYTDRNPVAWKLSGSNDKATWTTLDEQKNNRSLPDEDFQEYRFKPRSKGSYRYYRFEFAKMRGGTRIQLSEINLYTTVQSAVKTTFVSGTGSGKEGAAMAADGYLHTKWCVDEPRLMPYTIVLDAGQPTAVTEYRFYSGDDTHTYPDRNPVTWKLSGSNDQKNWTAIDEQKNNRRLRDENEQEYRFKTPQAGSFRYFRFEFISVTNGTRIQLSEIKLYK